MKIRNLALLIVLAGILIAWAAWTMRPQPKAALSLIGAKVLPGLPINRVNRIVLTGATNTLTLAKARGTWTVASRFDYPADFDKIADCLILLGDLTVGQVIMANESQKAALHLLDPATVTTGSIGQAATRLELRDANDGLIANLLIGKQFMRAAPEGGTSGSLAFGDYADGQYVQTDDGRIFLIGQILDRLTDDIKTWLDSKFISVTPDDIHRISVTGPDRPPIMLARPKDTAPFVLEGLNDDEGALDAAKVNQVSGAMNFLGFDDIAAPTLSPKETGLEHPVVFEVQTKRGQIYTLRIGNTLTNDTFDRYVQVTTAWKVPAEQTTAEKGMSTEPEANTNQLDTAKAGQQGADEARETNAHLSKWIFILKSYRVAPLLIKRTELIKKTAPSKETVKPVSAD